MENAIIEKLKLLVNTISEDTSDYPIHEGRELLLQMKELGLSQEKVYSSVNSLLEIYTLEKQDDFIKDLLDMVVGWYSGMDIAWDDKE